MHECPDCGMVCDCDGEDTWNPPPPDCRCALVDCETSDDAEYDEAEARDHAEQDGWE